MTNRDISMLGGLFVIGVVTLLCLVLAAIS
jgi:hypothetical protein